MTIHPIACLQGTIEAELEELKAQCKVIRVLVHTQIKKVSNWGQKKAHMLEVQVSGRSPARQLSCVESVISSAAAKLVELVSPMCANNLHTYD